MKTILVISDHTPEAEHAAAFALMLAQSIQANILVADTIKAAQRHKEEPVMAMAGATQTEDKPKGIKDVLKLQINHNLSYVPVIGEIDISEFDSVKLAETINKNQIFLVIEGKPDILPQTAGNLKFNIQSVLNKVLCPLLLIPKSWALKNFERIVYIADLRYCRLHVLKYLAKLALPNGAGISIAHLSAKGLTDIMDTYAGSIFNDEIVPLIHYGNLSLNNIKEKDLNKAVDVIINGMHTDLVVMVNHRFHFEKILGGRIGQVLPPEITIPVLIFPL
jgi:hypothetical protein